ncbi:hypothetical protein H072_10284 [Dactylellina haptotyla CBS 200.50]|uniref:Uncharacterized protein n=1 Tax=Dactylellina haptotyla (strain CBS 200.50) TaxID=1284197 RepID=S8A0Q0_DACHA|nr:hypothetical protein H072_10284 [Dactylellina haptotyla CBS 200.50]
MHSVTIFARLFLIIAILFTSVQGQGLIQSGTKTHPANPAPHGDTNPNIPGQTIPNPNIPPPIDTDPIDNQPVIQEPQDVQPELGVQTQDVAVQAQEEETQNDDINIDIEDDWGPEQLARNQQDIKDWASRSLTALRESQKARLPPKSEWKEPHENFWATSIVVSPDQWAIFEEALRVKENDWCPLWLLMVATKDLVEIMKQADMLIEDMKKKRPQGLQSLNKEILLLHEEAWSAVEWVYNGRSIARTAASNPFKQPYVSGTEGTGYPIVPEWPLNAATYRKVLQGIFRTGDINGTSTLVIGGNGVVNMWYALPRAISALGSVITKVQALVNQEIKKFPETKKLKDPAGITYPAVSAPGKGREDIGYADYYQNRFVGGKDFDIRPYGGINSKGKITGAPWKQWGGGGRLTGDMYVAYTKLLNKVFMGVFPMMIEMFLDIMLAANLFLGRMSITPDEHFAIPWNHYNKDKDTIAWLETYPEWSGAEMYATAGKQCYVPDPMAYKKPPREGGKLWSTWDYFTEWRDDAP